MSIRPHSLASAVALTFLVGAHVAVAAGPPETHPASPAPPVTSANAPIARERWYGYQTLLADGGALMVLVAGFAVNDRDDAEKVQVGAGVAYVLDGPVIHLVHRRGFAVLGSFGLRVGLPVMGGLLGAALGSLMPYDDGDEVVIGTSLGLLGGIATAVAIDASLVAWERAPPTIAALPSAALTWRPCVIRIETRTGLGIVGQF